MENNNFNPSSAAAVNVRKTSGEMFPLIEQWLDSKEKQSDFCQFHGLKISTFTYWLKKYRDRQSGSALSGGFVSLSVQGKPRGEIEIAYPNGVTVRLGSSVGAGFIRELAGQC